MKYGRVIIVLGLLFASVGAAQSQDQKVLVNENENELGIGIGIGEDEGEVGMRRPRWGEPIPICGSCVPRERVIQPGVGFELGVGYGTAAVRFLNGSVVDVGRIDGSKEYIEVMKRLSPPYRRQGPPFSSPWEELKWRASQALRKARRLRGLPSTIEIEILSNFLTQLRIATSSLLSTPIHEIVTSLPTLPNLSYADLKEVFTFSSLKPLSSYKHPFGPLHPLAAAYAGMGYGLCRHWGNISACEAEEDALPEKLTLLVSFTHEELSVAKALVYNAHTAYLFDEGRWADLGYAAWLQNEANSTFWNEIGGKVALLADKGASGGREIEVLLLVGEDAREKRFLDAVWRALDRPVRGRGDGMRNGGREGFDEVFVGARGAAELAKRWVGETWDCEEGKWCEGNRKPGDDD